MPLCLVLKRMEQEGVAIDAAKLAALSGTVMKDLDRLTTEIHRLAGEEFNINSAEAAPEDSFREARAREGAQNENGVLDRRGGAFRARSQPPDRGERAGVSAALEDEEHLYRRAAAPRESPDRAHPHLFQPDGHGDGATVVERTEPAEYPRADRARARDPERLHPAARKHPHGRRLFADRAQDHGASLEGRGLRRNVPRGGGYSRADRGADQRRRGKRGDGRHARPRQDDQFRRHLRHGAPGALEPAGHRARRGEAVHRRVFREISGRERVHRFRDRPRAPGGLRRDAPRAQEAPGGKSTARTTAREASRSGSPSTCRSRERRPI